MPSTFAAIDAAAGRSTLEGEAARFAPLYDDAPFIQYYGVDEVARNERHALQALRKRRVLQLVRAFERDPRRVAPDAHHARGPGCLGSAARMVHMRPRVKMPESLEIATTS
jgi:hypothetical protein